MNYSNNLSSGHSATMKLSFVSCFQTRLQYLLATRPKRRPKDAQGKPHKCSEPGCKSSFYESRNLRAHEVKKHGRPKRVAAHCESVAFFNQVLSASQEQPISNNPTPTSDAEHILYASAMSQMEPQVTATVDTERRDDACKEQPHTLDPEPVQPLGEGQEHD